MLNAYKTSLNSFIFEWSSKIAGRFDLPVSDVLDIYDDEEDKHNSEMRTRYMFKWRTFSHQSGTPFAYVNGIRLEHFPETA